MGFHDVTYPLPISYGSSSGISHNAVVISLDSGQEQRIARHDSFRKVFTAEAGIHNWDDVNVLRAFVAARRGPVHSFKVFDHIDNTTNDDGRTAPTNVDQTIGTGDGSETEFQLRKRYGDDNYSVYWNITKPDTDSVVVAVNGVGTSAFSVDYSTGIITLDTAAPIGHAVTAGCRYHVPCRFGDDTTEITAQLQSTDIGDFGSIEMLEDMDPSIVNDEYDYGNAKEVEFPTTAVVDLLYRLQVVNDATGNARMPPTAALEFGGPYVVFINISGSILTVEDNGGTQIGTIANNSSGQLFYGPNDTWYLV